MEKTARGNRLHIGLYGRTNVGKSTLVNKLTNQDVSIVSDIEGTTTDIVYKPMELLPIGPVVFMDTAGFDDKTELAHKRTKKTINSFDKADIAVVICDYNGWTDTELTIVKKINDKKIPIIAVITKTDISNISKDKLDIIKKYTEHIIITDYNDKNIINNFKEELSKIIPDNSSSQTVTGNLVKEKDVVILVVPIDKEAPKGRLILPQVQMIRELLDKNSISIVVKESELENTLNMLKIVPKLVITDSQAFKQVSEIVPQNIPLTSFSILLANFKGDISEFIKGAKALDNLKNNDKILFFESCTHHAIDDDIARVKIPKLIERKTNKTFSFEYHSGCNIPDNISDYSYIIHCGACMTNAKEVLSRIEIAKSMNIPITNYGIIIAYCLGILDRAAEPILKYY